MDEQVWPQYTQNLCGSSQHEHLEYEEVQAPFSALMESIGSNRALKWICKYPQDMHRMLRMLTEQTYISCKEMTVKGVPVISLADPSAIPELMGEKRYQEFAAFYVILLLKKLFPYLDKTVIHLCPRTSLLLEKSGLVRAKVFHYENGDYADAVLTCAKDKEIRILGHRCIHTENHVDGCCYALELNPPKIKIQQMQETDWQEVAGIYNEGIISKKATVVEKLPEKEAWFAAHKKCLVARYLENVIGFVALNKEEIPQVSVYVEQDFQCQCVGTALLKEMQNGSEKKLQSLIFEKNRHSICLHEKCGFKKTGDCCFPQDPRKVLIYEWEKEE